MAKTIEETLSEIGYKNAAIVSDPGMINYAVALYALADRDWKIAAFYAAVMGATLFAAPIMGNYRKFN